MPKIVEFVLSAVFGAAAGLYFVEAGWVVTAICGIGAYIVWMLGKLLYRRLVMGKGKRLRGQGSANSIPSLEETLGLPPGSPQVGAGGLYAYGNGKLRAVGNRFGSGDRMTVVGSDEAELNDNQFGTDQPNDKE